MSIRGLYSNAFVGANIAWMVAGLITPSACRPSRDTQAHTRQGTPLVAQVSGEVSETNIYVATGPNALAPAAAKARPLVYVPNSKSATVSVIDPTTYRQVRTLAVGRVPQHVVPSYDLTRLWILNNASNSVTPIDPMTGLAGHPVHVDDPYNMYYTPDGQYAVVVAERQQRLDFRDPRTLRLVHAERVPCRGLDHVDFTLDGRYLIGTCEFSGRLVKVDLLKQSLVGYLDLTSVGPHGMSMPQDIRSSPDGRVFYVADMTQDGVHVIDPVAFRQVGFIPTGIGTHGITVGRGGRFFYVSNRGWHTIAGRPHGPGSVSVLDPTRNSIVATWPVPGGGSPDMGTVSADGTELWLTGRYDREVYVFDTATGTLTHRIPVGREPHGLCVWPQPGRLSLGHTGNMR